MPVQKQISLDTQLHTAGFHIYISLILSVNRLQLSLQYKYHDEPHNKAHHQRNQYIFAEVKGESVDIC